MPCPLDRTVCLSEVKFKQIFSFWQKYRLPMMCHIQHVKYFLCTRHCSHWYRAGSIPTTTLQDILSDTHLQIKTATLDPLLWSSISLEPIHMYHKKEKAIIISSQILSVPQNLFHKEKQIPRLEILIFKYS